MCKTCGIVSLVEDFVELFPISVSGPGHVVLSDYNFDETTLDYCIALCEVVLGQPSDLVPFWVKDVAESIDYFAEGHTRQEIEATKVFLELLYLIVDKEN